jgi:hypothetical protein
MEPGTEEMITRWNNTQHLQDLLEVGFWGAVRFRSIQGNPEYLHLYEIPGPEIFETEAYRYICRCEPHCPGLACQNKADPSSPSGPQMIHHNRNASRTLYRQVVTVNTATPRTSSPGRNGDPIGSVTSRCVLTIQMDLDPAKEADFLRWQEETHIPRCVEELPGFVSGRLARRVDDFSTAWPKYLILWELEGPEAVQGSPAYDAMQQDHDVFRMWSAAQGRLDNLMERVFPS